MEFKEFQTIIQKIDLTLSETVENAIVMFGKTKKGSTSAWHLLCGKKLKSVLQNCEEIVLLEDANNNQHKIGTSYQTETLFPNICYVQVKNQKKKICLIDSPGFGNTRGSLGILSSGYAHHRIFQTSINLKFILCFDQADLQKTGKQLIESIFKFLNFFKDIKGVKDSIVNHCAFLFNRVNKHANLKTKLLNLVREFRTQLPEQDQELIGDFITKMVSKDKIFWIKKAEVDEILESPLMIEEINEKINKWWSRGESIQPDHDKMFTTIDMSQINTSLLKELQISCISGQKSLNSYNELINHYDEWISKIFVFQFRSEYNIAALLNFMVKDFMHQPDDGSIFQIMKKFIQKETLQNGEQSLGSKLYKVKINKINKIYETKPSFCYNPQVRTMRKTVKKYEALQKIDQHFQQLSQSYIKNIVHECGSILKFLYHIFCEVYTVALEFKEEKLVKSYFYQIFCKIKELRFIFIVLNENQEEFEILNKICKNNKLLLGMMQKLEDSFLNSYLYEDKHYNPYQLLELYVKKLDLDTIERNKFVIDEYFVEAMFNQNIFKNDDCKKSLIKLIERYSDMVVQRMELEEQNSAHDYPAIYTESLKKQLFEEIFMAREWAIELHQMSNETQKKFFTASIKRLTSNLAFLLLYKNEYNLAKMLYDSFNMVSSICRTYERQIKNAQNDEFIPQSQIFRLKNLFVDYMASHFRTQEAIELLNEMISNFTLSTDKLAEIARKILALRTQQNDPKYVNGCEKKFFQQQYFRSNNNIKSNFEAFIKYEFF